jgi:hypothetical protein
MAIQDTDLFLVDRNNTNYKVEAQDIMAIEDTDLLLVNRGGSNYKLEASELKDYVSLPFGVILKEATLPTAGGQTQSSPTSICRSAGSRIYRSTDGFTWNQVYQGSQPQYRIAYGGNNTWVGVRYISGSTLEGIRSTDDGETWNTFTMTHDFFNGASGGSLFRSLASFTGTPGASGTSNFVVFTNSTSSGQHGPVASITTDGGNTWNYMNLPSAGNSNEEDWTILESSSTTISGSPVWGVAMLPNQGAIVKPSKSYFTINNGSSWETLNDYYIPYSGFVTGDPLEDRGSLGGGGNSLIATATISTADSNYADKTKYSTIAFYNGSVTEINLSNQILQTFHTRDLDSHILRCASYGDKIAAWGDSGAILLYDTTTGQAISARQTQLTNEGPAVIGFKDRFFFFIGDKVYYTNKFT